MTTFYSHKGGSGTSVLAAAHALGVGGTLVDLGGGDLAGILGMGTEAGEIRDGLVLSAEIPTDGPVTIDAGTIAPEDAAEMFAATPGPHVLVIRPCYVALKRALRSEVTPYGVVVVTEPGRALDVRDVSEVLGLEVLATIAHDPAVARAVDAGLLASRTPHSLVPVQEIAQEVTA